MNRAASPGDRRAKPGGTDTGGVTGAVVVSVGDDVIVGEVVVTMVVVTTVSAPWACVYARVCTRSACAMTTV